MDQNRVWLGNLIAAALAPTAIHVHPVRPVPLVPTDTMVMMDPMVRQASVVKMALLNTTKNLDLHLSLNLDQEALRVRQVRLEIQATKATLENEAETAIPAETAVLVQQAMPALPDLMAILVLEVKTAAMRKQARKALQETLDSVEMLVKPVMMATEVQQAIPAALVVPAPVAQLDMPVSLVRVVIQVMLVDLVDLV